jgi:hypothetical protein
MGVDHLERSRASGLAKKPSKTKTTFMVAFESLNKGRYSLVEIFELAQSAYVVDSFHLLAQKKTRDANSLK